MWLGEKGNKMNREFLIEMRRLLIEMRRLSSGSRYYVATHTAEDGTKLSYSRDGLSELKKLITANGDTFRVTFW
jgi:hypothetical protein